MITPDEPPQASKSAIRRGPPPPPPGWSGSQKNPTVSAATCSPVERVGKSSKLHLSEYGIDPSTFEWIIGVDAIQLKNGGELKSAQLAGLPGGNLCLFRYKPDTGFHMAAFAKEQVSIYLQENPHIVEFRVEVYDDAAVGSFICLMESQIIRDATGPWLELFKPALRSAHSALSDIVIGRARVLRPFRNDFGADTVNDFPEAIWGVADSELFILPFRKEIKMSEIVSWSLDNGEFTVLYLEDGVPHAAVLTASQADHEWFENRIRPMLDPDRTSADCLEKEIGSLGAFDGEPGSTTILLQRDDVISIWSEEGSPVMHYAWVMASRTILSDQLGKFLILHIQPEQGAQLALSLESPDQMITLSDDESWVMLIEDDGENRNGNPIRAVVRSGELLLAGRGPLPIASATSIRVDPSDDGLANIVTKWKPDGQEIELKYLAPESQAFAFWEWWDAEKAANEVAHAGPADLYSQYNAARKNNFLLVVFGDLLLLNRALESGTPMSTLCRKLEEMGGVTFAETKELRDETVAKILLLTSSLREIRQKFEIIASMSPYYCIESEAKWITQAFGSNVAAKAIQPERKRMVTSIRRQVRTVQSDLFRSLGQIEAAARPLESIFAREEIQRHWSSKLRVFTPQIAKAGIGVASIMFDPTGTTAVRMLGGVFATSGLGSILGYFQKDREAAAQIQRAAIDIFPWWQIFMKTLVVSIHETGEFMNDENSQAMKRDRKLLESYPEKDRTAAVKRISDQLRRRIIEERRNRFGEALAGSGVRIMQIFEDIERASGEEIRAEVDSFLESLVVSGKRRNLNQPAKL